jgi:GNAT superfamily N-acetyltransferase
MDLLDAYLRNGESSNYQFMLLENDDTLLAYGCYGLLPLTDRRYHLHWLVVNRDFRGNGYGRILEAAIVEKIRGYGGLRVYAEFSERTQHRPVRSFYEKCGYHPAAVTPDYYANGDHKVLYVKKLDTAP